MNNRWSLGLAWLLVTGCGSGDSTPRGQLTFANIVPRTGTFSTAYQSLVGATLLAQKMINDAGGVLGNDIAFQEFDEASGTNGSVPITAVADELIASDVQVWIGPHVSDSALIACPIAGANRRLCFAPNAGASALSTIADDDFAFRGIQLLGASAVAAGKSAYERGARSAATLHLANAVSTDQANIFADAFSAAGGLVQVDHGYTYDSANSSSFDAQSHLQAVFAGNPDVIFIYGVTADAVALLSAWDKAQWNGQWILGAVLGSPDVAASVGPAKLTGVLTYTAAPPDTNVQAAIAEAYLDANGFPLSEVNANIVYSTIQVTLLAALALEKAGEHDATKARDALRGISNAPGEPMVGALDYRRAVDVVRSGGDLDFQGLSAPLEFDEHGDFVGNVSERRFNASGSLDTLRILVPESDF